MCLPSLYIKSIHSACPAGSMALYSYGARRVHLDCKIDARSPRWTTIHIYILYIILYIYTTVGREVNKLIALDASCVPAAAADVAGAPPASPCRCTYNNVHVGDAASDNIRNERNFSSQPLFNCRHGTRFSGRFRRVPTRNRGRFRAGGDQLYTDEKPGYTVFRCDENFEMDPPIDSNLLKRGETCTLGRNRCASLRRSTTHIVARRSVGQ